jgi:DNA-binding HxlR family transcriptional regulator
MTVKIETCPVVTTVNAIGGKWKPIILYHLTSGPKRFNELRRLIPDITQRMLTMQLRALEADGIVSRTVHAEVPPRVDYALTEKGWTLDPVFEAMIAWGERYGPKPAAKPRATPSPSRARSGASR